MRRRVQAQCVNAEPHAPHEWCMGVSWIRREASPETTGDIWIAAPEKTPVGPALVAAASMLALTVIIAVGIAALLIAEVSRG